MKPRGRPKKYRFIQEGLKISKFSPRGRPGRPEEVNLTVDELEAIRLADYRNLRQKEAAEGMRISQQTFSRILKRARRALADAVANGKIIRVQGGQSLQKP